MCVHVSACVHVSVCMCMCAVRDPSASEVGGTKTSLTYLWQRLRDEGVDVALLWDNICDLAVRSLVCVDDVIPYQPNSFEVRMCVPCPPSPAPCSCAPFLPCLCLPCLCCLVTRKVVE